MNSSTCSDIDYIIIMSVGCGGGVCARIWCFWFRSRRQAFGSLVSIIRPRCSNVVIVVPGQPHRRLESLNAKVRCANVHFIQVEAVSVCCSLTFQWCILYFFFLQVYFRHFLRSFMFDSFLFSLRFVFISLFLEWRQRRWMNDLISFAALTFAAS